MAKIRGGIPIWTIASGKGGVGVSVLVASLAAEMARRGLEVRVADHDARRGGDLGTYLGKGGLRPAAAPPLPGVSLAAGVPVGTGALRRGAAALVPVPGLVLVDPGTRHPGRTAAELEAADRPILVLTPEPAAVEGASRVLAEVALLRTARWLDARRRRDRDGDLLGRARLDALRGADGWLPPPGRLAAALGVPAHDLLLELGRRPIDLVVNQVRRADDVGAAGQFAQVAMERFGLAPRLRGAVGHDERMWIAVRKRLPVTASGWGTTWDDDIRDLADRLLTGRDVGPAGTDGTVGTAGSPAPAVQDARGSAPGGKEGP
ncbi:hypothetical protein L6R50_07350 [Myxococcota bacterium]|nr:hypothetical protein [Myxococcota bacterium]